MVFHSSQIHRGLQSPSLLSRTQCAGKNMASHSSARYPQSIFYNPRRTPLCPALDISQHTEESVSSYGISASISINYYVALFMQCCIIALCVRHTFGHSDLQRMVCAIFVINISREWRLHYHIQRDDNMSWPNIQLLQIVKIE
jgi:hypothetical protein